jgi:hypothetical protein
MRLSSTLLLCAGVAVLAIAVIGYAAWANSRDGADRATTTLQIKVSPAATVQLSQQRLGFRPGGDSGDRSRLGQLRCRALGRSDRHPCDGNGANAPTRTADPGADRR